MRRDSLPDHSDSRLSRHPFDYTVEVCAVCGMGLSMGIGPSTGRCPDHAPAGGVVIRVAPRPADEQMAHRYAPSRRDLTRLVARGAIPPASDDEGANRG